MNQSFLGLFEELPRVAAPIAKKTDCSGSSIAFGGALSSAIDRKK
jgi:hypothetical protein